MLKNDIQISCDRDSYVVRLILPDGFRFYKESLHKHREFFEQSFIESTLACACPDGYYCTVKSRKSIKDCLCGNGYVDISLMHLVIKSLNCLLESCEKHKILPQNIIFDYSAVFINSAFSEIKFIYMPGAEYVGQLTDFKELIKIVFLHMYDKLSEEDYQKINALIGNIETSYNIESLGGIFKEIEEVIAPYIFNKKGLTKSKILKLLFDDKGQKTKKSLRPQRKNKVLQKAIFKKDTAKPQKHYVEVLGGINLKGTYVKKEIINGKSSVIKIGRDGKWSDIIVNDITASRKHAELHIDHNKKMTVKDMSLNGTCVDGIRIKDRECAYNLDSDIKILITEECEVLVRYKNA